MLRILIEAKKALDEGYKYVGFNSKKEPEKVEALIKLCETFDLFCGKGLSKKELLKLKDDNRFFGIDLRDTFELKNGKKLVIRSGRVFNKNEDHFIKILEFEELVSGGFWI